MAEHAVRRIRKKGRWRFIMVMMTDEAEFASRKGVAFPFLTCLERPVYAGTGAASPPVGKSGSLGLLTSAPGASLGGGGSGGGF